MIKIGDRLVVQKMPYPAYVEKIEYDSETARTIVKLDWKERGKSQVYLNEKNLVWYKYNEIN